MSTYFKLTKTKDCCQMPGSFIIPTDRLGVTCVLAYDTLFWINNGKRRHFVINAFDLAWRIWWLGVGLRQLFLCTENGLSDLINVASLNAGIFAFRLHKTIWMTDELSKALASRWLVKNACQRSSGVESEKLGRTCVRWLLLPIIFLFRNGHGKKWIASAVLRSVDRE